MLKPLLVDSNHQTVTMADNKKLCITTQPLCWHAACFLKHLWFFCFTDCIWNVIFPHMDLLWMPYWLTGYKYTFSYTKNWLWPFLLNKFFYFYYILNHLWVGKFLFLYSKKEMLLFVSCFLEKYYNKLHSESVYIHIWSVIPTLHRVKQHPCS